MGFSQSSGNGNRAQVGDEDGSSCTNYLKFVVTWSLLVSGFLQSLPHPFKSGRKRLQKVGDEDKTKVNKKQIQGPKLSVV